MTSRAGPRTRHALALLPALAAAAALLAAGCSGSKRQVEQVPVEVRRVPEPLRGTIGSLASSTAGEPILISGFGLVVGLNGTGGNLLDERIAATMEREMALKGIGAGNSDAEGTLLEDPITKRPKSAAELLRDPNVAVALVQAVIPRGAPDSYNFDVYVQAMNATSLEGGTLWTTDLRLGPPGVFGGVQTIKIAEARGELFINPFEDPAAGEFESRTVGRVLAGGLVTAPLGVRLTLDVPSHSRARTIAHAVNSRFPRGPGDRDRIARGRDDAIIELTVPWNYQERPNEFLKIVEHLPVDLGYPQELGRRYVSAMRDNPGLREDMVWCLIALGDQALPFARELYEDPDPEIRMAALRAGALLGDVRASPPLMDIARAGEPAHRTDAIALLGELDGGPMVDITLRELVKGSGALTTRVAAYEALARRAERAEYSRLLSIEAQRPASSGLARTPAELQIISRRRISASVMHGIERVTIPGKFVLDIVPDGEPLIYVTQSGTPRIVLFGADLALERPLLASAWEDRLLIVADTPIDTPRLKYENYRTGLVRIENISPSLPALVAFMASDPRPEDRVEGLGMSYSEVVGALHALYKDGATTAAFATETDKLMAELVEASRTGRVLERPETVADKDRPTESDDGLVVDAAYLKAERARKPQVVPLAPVQPKNNK